MLPIDKKDIKEEEYKRHYKLDPEHWYMLVKSSYQPGKKICRYSFYLHD